MADEAARMRDGEKASEAKGRGGGVDIVAGFGFAKARKVIKERTAKGGVRMVMMMRTTTTTRRRLALPELDCHKRAPPSNVAGRGEGAKEGRRPCLHRLVW